METVELQRLYRRKKCLVGALYFWSRRRLEQSVYGTVRFEDLCLMELTGGSDTHTKVMSKPRCLGKTYWYPGHWEKVVPGSEKDTLMFLNEYNCFWTCMES